MTTPQPAKPAQAPKTQRFRWRTMRWTIAKVGVALVAVTAVAYLMWYRPVPTHSHRVARGDVVKQVYGRGTIESRREAQLGFDLAGRLSQILVDEGDSVSIGQELAKLVTKTLDADIRTARYGVSAARSTLGRLRADEKKARAALAFAKAEQARAAPLVPQAVSQREFDAAKQATRIARVELDRVLAVRKEATRAIVVASGGVAQRKATALRASLLAPFDGLIVRRFKEPGDTVVVGTTVLRLIDTSELIVRARVDETTLATLKLDQKVRVRLAGHKLNKAAGKLIQIGREVDRQTHDLLVEATLGERPKRIAVGQRADVFIEMARKSDVVFIPLEFLHRDGDSTFCYVNRGGKIRRVAVETGLYGGDRVQITAGLDVDDVVLRSRKPGARLPTGRSWKSAK